MNEITITVPFTNQKVQATAINILAIIIMLVVFVLIEPMLWLGMGWISGWITKVTIGEPAVSALNTTFGTSFNKNILPYIGAALSWVGSFFKTFKTNK